MIGFDFVLNFIFLRNDVFLFFSCHLFFSNRHWLDYNSLFRRRLRRIRTRRSQLIKVNRLVSGKPEALILLLLAPLWLVLVIDRSDVDISQSLF